MGAPQISNEELIRKAVITAADALATNGKLNAAQSDKFIDYVVNETVLKDQARVIRFRNEQMDIDKIGVGRRLAMPAVEARDPGKRRGITTSKISLTPKEIILPFEITDNFKELNLEGANVEDHIIQMMARQLGNDLEELGINGDTTGIATLESDIVDGGSSTQYVKDTYLALIDGWIRKADSGNLYDAGGANLSLSVFSGMLRQLPTKFRRNKANLRWYMSPDLAQLYYERLSSRATLLGDKAADGSTQAPYGIPIVEVPLWALQATIVEHVTLTGTTDVALRYAGISDVVVTPSTLGDTPTTPYIDNTDYAVDETTGEIHRLGGGAISNPQTVKVTYSASPQIVLTHKDNWIFAIGREIMIEKDRDIFKRANQYAVTTKIDVQFEEATAIVKGMNIGTG